MGLHASPQIAHLTCTYYEQQFIKRTAVTHIERPEAPLFGVTDPALRIAVMYSFLNGARQIDDICLTGLPLNTDQVLTILFHSSDQGVYPETVHDEYGSLVHNPMSVRVSYALLWWVKYRFDHL